jgi:hypothetical protein
VAGHRCAVRAAAGRAGARMRTGSLTIATHKPAADSQGAAALPAWEYWIWGRIWSGPSLRVRSDCPQNEPTPDPWHGALTESAICTPSTDHHGPDAWFRIDSASRVSFVVDGRVTNRDEHCADGECLKSALCLDLKMDMRWSHRGGSENRPVTLHTTEGNGPRTAASPCALDKRLVLT